MTTTRYLHALDAVKHDQAEGAQKEVLDQALAQVGFIPNMYANMVNAPAVLSTYLFGYARFRSESGLTPAEQEVVFLAISAANGCSYCTAAHSMIADKKSGVSADVLQAIRGGQPIPDARLAALHALTTEMVRSQGRPAPAILQAFLDAGYQERDVLYIILAMAVKTLSNFSNHAFATEVDPAFAAYRVA
ncbi:carboxymuconolactone decarboxylase family protein [Rubrivivax albus]|uniref:Carboxymuconolactone decarboxylase family protein n=1 Tax=Rubrivivax albus TaxID=2499835 RepID=A0A3S2TP65_9BURK|nr:carboxymuconolactone decarboxylase family protein [Rubrivivax albus]RVT49611.1 carboxymuconolactone decarboxylase family protein [Rubrivivax albus]